MPLLFGYNLIKAMHGMLVTDICWVNKSPTMRDIDHNTTTSEKVNAGDESKKEAAKEENIHQLERGETRGNCVACYSKLSKQHGRMKARNSTRKTNLKCDKCAKYFCNKCFKVAHEFINP